MKENHVDEILWLISSISNQAANNDWVKVDFNYPGPDAEKRLAVTIHTAKVNGLDYAPRTTTISLLCLLSKPMRDEFLEKVTEKMEKCKQLVGIVTGREWSQLM